MIGSLRVNNLLHNLTYDNFAYWVIFYDFYGISGTLSLRVKQFGIDQANAWIQKVLSFYDGQADNSIPPKLCLFFVVVVLGVFFWGGGGGYKNIFISK